MHRPMFPVIRVTLGQFAKNVFDLPVVASVPFILTTSIHSIGHPTVPNQFDDAKDNALPAFDTASHALGQPEDYGRSYTNFDPFADAEDDDNSFARLPGLPRQDGLVPCQALP